MTDFETRMTTAEVAKLVDRTPATLYRWVLAGIGPRSHKLATSGRRFYYKADVDAWLQNEVVDA